MYIWLRLFARIRSHNEVMILWLTLFVKRIQYIVIILAEFIHRFESHRWVTPEHFFVSRIVLWSKYVVFFSCYLSRPSDRFMVSKLCHIEEGGIYIYMQCIQFDLDISVNLTKNPTRLDYIHCNFFDLNIITSLCGVPVVGLHPRDLKTYAQYNWRSGESAI